MTFLNAKVGWLAWTDLAQPTVSLLFTTDGGIRWRTSRIAIPAAAAFVQQIDFANQLDGWLVLESDGASGQSLKWIFHTTNGGQTWASVVQNSSRFSEGASEHLVFTNSRDGWWLLSSPNQSGVLLYSSHNAGAQWRRVPISRPSSMGVTVSVAGPIFSRSQPYRGAFTVEDESIDDGAGVYSLFTYRTVNGGKNWTPVPPSLPPSSTFAAGPFYLNPTSAWTLFQGTLFKTANGGQTWTSPPGNGLPKLLAIYTPVAIALSSPRLAWLIGESPASGQQGPVSHLFMTSNGGMTWDSAFK